MHLTPQILVMAKLEGVTMVNSKIDNQGLILLSNLIISSNSTLIRFITGTVHSHKTKKSLMVSMFWAYDIDMGFGMGQQVGMQP